ncbi:intraflagellar transport-associated protein isoform X2 [Balearica regulorum gibbericeps]|uniref:intraflagellar transport-associated protein isoform X2 n=1 Tax=Balearica regulorum gibbericeps TaxID=100784 RepID=UPI003F621416
MGEQLLNKSILDQFINSHEQSYEEFLNTFTYLLKEEEGKTIQGNKVDSLRKTFSTSELSNRNKQDGSPGRSKEMWVSLPPQMPNVNETVMNESWKAGGSDGNDLSLSERVKVDKYLGLEDTDMDEETCSGSLVLPGEAEETVTYCTPFFDKPIHLKFRTLSVPQPSDSKAQEVLDINIFLDFGIDSAANMTSHRPLKIETTFTPWLKRRLWGTISLLPSCWYPYWHGLLGCFTCGKDETGHEYGEEVCIEDDLYAPASIEANLLGDDVQPFSLDEEFDYDNAALTPKFSEAELKAIIKLSEEKKMGTDVKSA